MYGDRWKMILFGETFFNNCFWRFGPLVFQGFNCSFILVLVVGGWNYIIL